MRVSDFGRYALCICASLSLLAGCGGSQPPMGSAGAMPQSTTRSASYRKVYLFQPPRNGRNPEAGLLDVNGTLYGTTTVAGKVAKGTVFSISPSGLHTVIYKFRGRPDGNDPQSGLLDVNGTLYGTTKYGGASRCGSPKGNGCGTVYSITTSGSEKVLYAFKGFASDGAYPVAGLIDVNGTLYGTTAYGGSSVTGPCFGTGGVGCGTVFSITTSGKETVLHKFAGGNDGAHPRGQLIEVNGVLYGTTSSASSTSGCESCFGTVYSITPAGSEKVLYAFQGAPDGAFPQSGLVYVDGMLYGTTSDGGLSDCNGGECGTIYRVSTTGVEKVLYRFAGGSDGANPTAGLIEVSGTLYGTTAQGGGGSCFFTSGNCGTVFSVTTAGVETVLHRFLHGTDGFDPVAPLTNAKGTLYGTTYLGGDGPQWGFGTIFSVSP